MHASVNLDPESPHFDQLTPITNLHDAALRALEMLVPEANQTDVLTLGQDVVSLITHGDLDQAYRRLGDEITLARGRHRQREERLALIAWFVDVITKVESLEAAYESLKSWTDELRANEAERAERAAGWDPNP